MPTLAHCVAASLTLVSTLASGETISTVADLDAQSPVVLTREELAQLLPGARVSKLTNRGNTHTWVNDTSGSFVARSDGRSSSGVAGSAPGKWHISDDGRYCILVEWKGAPEEWCRVILKAGSGYYAAASDKKTARVLKLEISK